jgi:hypothetical protein
MPKTTKKISVKKPSQQFKSKNGLSRRALLIWVLIFAAVGGIVLYKSFAASGGVSYGVSAYSSRRVPLSSAVYSYHWNWGCSGSNGPYAFYLYTSGGALKASGSYSTNGGGHDVYTSYNNYYAVIKNNSGVAINCVTNWYDR